jgi:hypothetical protein
LLLPLPFLLLLLLRCSAGAAKKKAAADFDDEMVDALEAEDGGDEDLEEGEGLTVTCYKTMLC